MQVHNRIFRSEVLIREYECQSEIFYRFPLLCIPVLHYCIVPHTQHFETFDAFFSGGIKPTAQKHGQIRSSIKTLDIYIIDTATFQRIKENFHSRRNSGNKTKQSKRVQKKKCETT